MPFGLSNRAIKKLSSVFAEFVEIERVVIFGSRADWNYNEGSDIDIAIFGNFDFELFLKIKVRLSDINLPYKIDLHDYFNIENNELRDRIDKSGVEFFAN